MRNELKKIIAFTAIALALAGCRRAPEVLHVYSVFVDEELQVLRTPCRDFTARELRSAAFRRLAADMVATVTSPEQGGVGIAAPQVGDSRRVIVVCRLDKPGEPYEVYPNVHLDSLWGPVNVGPEGCLSIVPYRGDVPRSEYASVRYVDPVTREQKQETVSGYVARIFQHECDHLDGILYTDRCDTVKVNESWKAEKGVEVEVPQVVKDHPFRAEFTALEAGAKTCRAIDLFNGKDFTNFTIFKKDGGFFDPQLPGFETVSDPLFKGTKAVGIRHMNASSDPEGDLIVEDGMMHMSGEGLGYAVTREAYGNYYFRVRMRFGTYTTADPGVEWDGGILYHVGPEDGFWPICVECQGMKDRFCDYWFVGGATGKTTGHTVEPHGRNFRVLRSGGTENPINEWNTMEFITLGDKSWHYLNGELVNEATDMNVSSGRILVQLEESEAFYKDLLLIPLK